MDLTQLWIKNVWKRDFLESSKKQNLNLSHAGNSLHNIYIVLSIISNLEMI